MAEYEFVYKDGKRRPAHVVLMEQILGRPLKENEVVHHINGSGFQQNTALSGGVKFFSAIAFV